MKHLDYLLHTYFEFLYEKDQMWKKGGTVIGRAIEDGGAGEATFDSRIPSGVEYTDLSKLLELSPVECALRTLKRREETSHYYAIINMCYSLKEDGSKRSPKECVEHMGVSERSFRYQRTKAKKIMRKILGV